MEQCQVANLILPLTVSAYHKRQPKTISLPDVNLLFNWNSGIHNSNGCILSQYGDVIVLLLLPSVRYESLQEPSAEKTKAGLFQIIISVLLDDHHLLFIKTFIFVQPADFCLSYLSTVNLTAPS